MTDLQRAISAAGAAYGSGDRGTAEQLCREVLRADPRHFDALTLLGVLMAQAGRPHDAAPLFREALAARPGNAVAHNNLGNALRELGQHSLAVQSYDAAVRLDPGYAEALNNRGGALRAQGRIEEALASFERALALRPDAVDAWYNRGVALQDLQRVEEAIESYQRALAIQPRFSSAHYNIGNAYQQLRRHETAVRHYEQALAIDSSFAPAWNNRGNSLWELARPLDALRSFEQAIRLAPGLVDAFKNRAGVLSELGRREEAAESYRRALDIDPHLAGLAGARMQARLQLCDWAGLEAEVSNLLAQVERGERATGAFVLLAITDDPALQRRAAEGWVDSGEPVSRELPPIARAAREERIRIGYFSADFHDHATAYLAAELFELHDRRRFETVAFSFGPERQDGMRRRLAAAFERFVDVRSKSDREIAALSRSFGIDIAIDLKGYTLHSRPGIFAHRAAPVQVNYLGYPGTFGKPFMDYLIADAVVIPPEARAHYSERIVFLPHSYQVNDRRRTIGSPRPSRAQLGLPPTGFVFCCFNGVYKITPQVFDGWMRILQGVTGSCLWLLGGQPASNRNLQLEAQRRGVDPNRLVFAGPLPLPQHLARFAAADLFLDTFPCGAHTTASDALWAGVPLLTRLGQTFASRVASSLLHAVGLPELITDSPQAYEALAIELAGDATLLLVLRARLAANRSTMPLFDTPRYVRHFERALTQMHARTTDGLAPADLVVAADVDD